MRQNPITTLTLFRFPSFSSKLWALSQMQFALTIHKLKSSLLMLGMESLRDDMNFMEKHAQSKPHIPMVKIRFDKLMAIWVSAKKELEKALKVLK